MDGFEVGDIVTINALSEIVHQPDVHMWSGEVIAVNGKMITIKWYTSGTVHHYSLPENPWDNWVE